MYVCTFVLHLRRLSVCTCVRDRICIYVCMYVTEFMYYLCQWWIVPRLDPSRATIRCCEISKSGRFLAFCGDDHTLKVLDVQSNAVLAVGKVRRTLCMYVCMYVCNRLHMYVYLWVPSSACFYRQGHVISFVRTYVCTYVCMYVCMYVYHLIFKTFFLFVYSAIQIRWKWLHGRRMNARWLFSQVPPLQPNLGEPFFSNYLLGNKW